MNKRQLNKQQQKRIAKKQQRELASGNLDTSSTVNCNGRIVGQFGQHVDVESTDSVAPHQIIRCFQRANLPPLVTGDYVVWEAYNDDEGVVTALGPRKSVFGRADFRGELKPIAANIDLVVLMIAPVPEAFFNLIDRYIVAVENLGLPLLLVINKADLINTANQAYFDSILSIYSALGYPVLKTSVHAGEGMVELEDALRDKTAVVVGQSGVGKSSLINLMAPQTVTAAGDMSRGKAKGTHTTTSAQLHHLGICDLIDSPGIREFHLEHISAAGVLAGFRELQTLAAHCRFRDCQHRNEPDCAVLAAAAAGEISTDRLKSYFRILQSL